LLVCSFLFVPAGGALADGKPAGSAAASGGKATPPAFDPGVLVGEVVSADGKPVAGAKVLLRGRTQRGAQTDAAGRFRFEYVQPGHLSIQASKGSLISLRVEFDGQRVPGFKTGKFAPIKLTVSAGKVIKVLVTSAATGKPLEGVKLRFWFLKWREIGVAPAARPNAARRATQFGDRLCEPGGDWAAEFAAVVGRESGKDRLRFGVSTVSFLICEAGGVAGQDRRAVRTLAEAGRVGFDDFGEEAGVCEHLCERFERRPEGAVRQARERILKAHLVPIGAFVTVNCAGDAVGPAKVRVEIDHIADFFEAGQKFPRLGKVVEQAHAVDGVEAAERCEVERFEVGFDEGDVGEPQQSLDEACLFDVVIAALDGNDLLNAGPLGELKRAAPLAGTQFQDAAGVRHEAEELAGPNVVVVIESGAEGLPVDRETGQPFGLRAEAIKVVLQLRIHGPSLAEIRAAGHSERETGAAL